MAAEIKTHIGRLPEFWDRNVLFFVNLYSLFFGNQGQTDELDKEVKGIQTYGGRLIPITNLLYKGSGRNLLLLEAKPNLPLVEYFSEGLKLDIPEYHILPREQYLNLGKNSEGELIDLLKNHSADFADGFVMDELLFNVSKLIAKKPICSFEASHFGNNKLLLHQQLEENGLPVFDCRIAENVGEVSACRDQLTQMGYSRFVIKSQIGASGIGIYHLNQGTKVEQIPEYLFYEGPAMVQGWLDDSVEGVTPICSPSVQLFLNEDSVSLYDMTEQFLNEDRIHQGNLAPPRFLKEDESLMDELNSQAGFCGKWLHDQGYRGTASVDFLVINRNDQYEIYVCEINARVTGATYPAVLARHLLPDGAWLMRNLSLTESLIPRTILDLLEQNNLLFLPGMERGVFPINFNQNTEDTVHKIQFLYLSKSIEDCFQLLTQIELLMPTDTFYDRD